MTPSVRAHLDPKLVPRVVSRQALLYSTGADPSLDRPAHVRAGSALTWIGGALAVVQDDACFIAVISREGDRVGSVSAICLPDQDGARQFDDARGNKKKKLDLEASLVIDGTLIAFGSGSSPVRERIAIVSEGERVDVVHAAELYAMLRAERAFSGSELNLEGAALEGGDIVLFQRGNGAGEAVDATGRIAADALLAYLRGRRPRDGDGPPCPPLRDVVSWDLGQIDGVRLTFTDGASAPDGSLAFLACAEASADATSDGPISGVVIGRLDDRARVATFSPVLDERGAPLVDKAEGLAFDREDRTRAFVVIDRDDPVAPSELCEIRLIGAPSR